MKARLGLVRLTEVRHQVRLTQVTLVPVRLMKVRLGLVRLTEVRLV